LTLQTTFVTLSHPGAPGSASTGTASVPFKMSQDGTEEDSERDDEDSAEEDFYIQRDVLHRYTELKKKILELDDSIKWSTMLSGVRVKDVGKMGWEDAEGSPSVAGGGAAGAAAAPTAAVAAAAAAASACTGGVKRKAPSSAVSAQ
jgi:hypothetical protein